MEYSCYVARKRCRIDGINGTVNIPWGTVLEARDGFLWWQGKPLCGLNSQNIKDYFSQNDDGRGQERGALVNSILACLAPRNERDTSYKARWKKVWRDAVCLRYKRPEHSDFFLWNQDFFNAPIPDLWHVARLVGAKPCGR